MNTIAKKLVRWWFTVKIAFHGILGNPLRSILTILGVVIGVASVVSLMGIGEGARQAVVEQFESLGKNVIEISANDPSVEFRPDFVPEILERVESVNFASPVIEAEAVVKWRRVRTTVDVIGVSKDFLDIRDAKLVSGHFINSIHEENRSPVVVLGYNIGKDLLGGRNPVGRSINLNSKTYRIIGVLEPKGEGKADGIDDKIIIPYSSAMSIAESRTIPKILLKSDTKEDAAISVVQLGRIIKRQLGLDQSAPTPASMGGENGGMSGGMDMDTNVSFEDGPEPDSPFKETSKDSLITVTNLNQLVEEADQANRVMTLLLGGIAAVSLLVGGLGIMNIMLVSVSERTSEIGIRRAFGASQVNLLLQFLLEAIFISIIGVIIGVFVGIWGLDVFDNYGFTTALTMNSIKIASAVAISSGILFGVYPAIIASSVTPAEALRRE